MAERTPVILIVDDEPGLVQAAAMHLQQAGYEVLWAYDGHTGLRVVFDKRPDLVILDVMMPRMNGFDVCQRIREMSDVPIIMLTARGSQEEIIRGFQLGADDYMVKPFKPGELTARIGAVLRRAQSAQADLSTAGLQYRDERLYIDISSRLVEVCGERLRLSATEFKLLSLLLQNAGRVLESNTILTQVWGPEYRDEVAYVRVYISHLRQKIEVDPSAPEYILTERQVGYYFVRHDTA